MFTIRKEQLEVFEKSALQDFENLMLEHLKQFDAEHSQDLGEANVRTLIRSGMDRAKKYGLTNRGPVRFFIELMYLLGRDFDTNPQFPWAARALSDPAVENQMQRANRLFDDVVEHLQAAGDRV